MLNETTIYYDQKVVLINVVCGESSGPELAFLEYCTKMAKAYLNDNERLVGAPVRIAHGFCFTYELIRSES